MLALSKIRGMVITHLLQLNWSNLTCCHDSVLLAFFYVASSLSFDWCSAIVDRPQINTRVFNLKK